MDSQTSNTSSLGQWLDGIGLGHYRERLQQNGFNTLETIIQMSRRYSILKFQKLILSALIFIN
jgi:hypothetical protein